MRGLLGKKFAATKNKKVKLRIVTMLLQSASLELLTPKSTLAHLDFLFMPTEAVGFMQLL